MPKGRCYLGIGFEDTVIENSHILDLTLDKKNVFASFINPILTDIESFMLGSLEEPFRLAAFTGNFRSTFQHEFYMIKQLVDRGVKHITLSLVSNDEHDEVTIETIKKYFQLIADDTVSIDISTIKNEDFFNGSQTKEDIVSIFNTEMTKDQMLHLQQRLKDNGRMYHTDYYKGVVKCEKEERAQVIYSHNEECEKELIEWISKVNE